MHPDELEEMDHWLARADYFREAGFFDEEHDYNELDYDDWLISEALEDAELWGYNTLSDAEIDWQDAWFKWVIFDPWKEAARNARFNYDDIDLDEDIPF